MLEDGISPHLLQFPSEVLELVWRAIGAAGNVHQHALHCTCKAARQATSEFIHKLKLYVDVSKDWTSEVQSCLQRMATFPSFAIMTHLCVSLLHILPDSPWVQPSSFLPCLMGNAADKLSCLKKLDINFGGACLGFGDTASITSVCPLLTSLELCGFTANTPVFAPLAQLAALRSLSVQKLSRPLDSQVLASLSGLSQITKLELRSVQPADNSEESESDEEQTDQVIPVGQVLPHLRGLLSLQSLELSLPMGSSHEGGDEGLVLAEAQTFSVLQRLSQLSRFSWTELHIDEEGPTISGGVSAQLALITQLVDLSLPTSILGADDIRFLAGMPRLTKLEVLKMRPSEDCSSLECRWREVVLGECPNPHTMLLLPIQRLENVHISSHVAYFSLRNGRVPDLECWGKALTMMSRWRNFQDIRIVLHSRSSGLGTFPRTVTSALFAPLKDWAKEGHLGLRGWAIKSHDVLMLVEGLPTLKTLSFQSCQLTRQAIAAIASAECLTYLNLFYTVVPEADVMALAMARCLAVPPGLPLTINVWPGIMLAEQLERCQATLDAFARSGRASRVKIVQR